MPTIPTMLMEGLKIHKAILIFFMIVVSANSEAGWVEVVSGEQFTVYANTASISTRNGISVKMFDLLDWRTKRVVSGGQFKGKPFLSVVGLREYDCEGQSRNLSLSGFSENMGGGAFVVNFDVSDGWAPIKPGSQRDSLSELACKEFIPAKDLTRIDSSPPGARIVINSEFVGEAPVFVDLKRYVSTENRFSRIIVKAMPARDGCVGAELIDPNRTLPVHMFFDTRLCPITPSVDLNIN